MSRRFVHAQKGPGKSVIYFTDDGREIKYSGGDISWRTNNPGDLNSGAVAARNGQIGKYKKFAVFPDYESGHAALIDSLKTTFGNQSLEQMIKTYAPSSENDTKKYLRFLRDKTGVTDDQLMSSWIAWGS